MILREEKRVLKEKLHSVGRKKLIAIIAVALAALVLVIDLGYHASAGMTSSVKTLPAKKSEIAASIDTRAYIVRDEKLVWANMTGNVAYSVGDGERVSKNGSIADIYYQSGGSKSLIDTLVSLKERRNVLGAAARQWDEATDTDIDARINDVYERISRYVKSGDSGSANKLRFDLQVLLCIKEKARGTLDTVKAIAECDAEIAALEERIGESAETVKAGTPAWFYSQCDGYEERLSYDEVMYLTPDRAKELFFAESEGDTTPEKPDDDSDVADTDESDESDESDDEDGSEDEGGLDIYDKKMCIGKLVHSEVWYAVCIVDKEITPFLKVGRSYAASMGYDNVTVTLEKIIFESGSNDRVLVFSCDTAPIDFGFRRVTDISIAYTTYEGFRIPTSAVRMIDGVLGVYIKRGFLVEFREIVPIYYSEGIMVADSDPENTSGEYRVLSENDNVILRGNGLYDGKIIK